MYKSLFLLFTATLLFACGQDNHGNSENLSDSSVEFENIAKEFEVKYKGALKNMMHDGDISLKAKLSDFENEPYFYALGAFENLKGEIQIFDGVPWNTTVVDSSIVFDRTYDKNATLLVYASVSEWDEVPVPADITNLDELEAFIEESAGNSSIDMEKPFPFLIEGSIGSLDWHVIDWVEGDTVHTHEKHKTSGLNGKLSNEPVNILGFYSNKHHRIFTHHSTNIHMHFKTEDGRLAGHVDDLFPGEGMVLKLPNTPD